MKKKLAIFTSIISFLTVAVVPAFAHVVVKPDTAGVAAFQTFTVSVPNEKDNNIIALRLLIPDGLKSVSPNVKPGWTITIKKSGNGDDAKVTEIDWTDGSIPAGQRDDFLFNAQVPSSETILNWKAYQIYQDGSVVSWDQKPEPKMTDDQREALEKKNRGPYSTTKIVNDLREGDSSGKSAVLGANLEQKTKVSMILSIVALALSTIALGMQSSKRK